MPLRAASLAARGFLAPSAGAFPTPCRTRRLKMGRAFLCRRLHHAARASAAMKKATAIPMPRKDPPPESKTAEALSAALPPSPVNAPRAPYGEGVPEGVGVASGVAAVVGAAAPLERAEAVPRLSVLADELKPAVEGGGEDMPEGLAPGDFEGETLALGTRLAVPLALAPALKLAVDVAVGLAEGVTEEEVLGLPPVVREAVVVGVGEAVSVVVDEVLALAPCVRDDVGVAVGLPVRVVLDVTLALAPRVRLAVGVPDGLAESVTVEVALALAPCVREDVGVAVGLPVRVVLDVTLALAPRVRLAVGVQDGLAESVTVEVALALAPCVREDVGVAVGLPVRVVLDVALALAPAVSNGVGVPVGLGERDFVEVALALAPTLRLGVGVAESLPLGEAVPDTLVLAFTDSEALPGENRVEGMTEPVPTPLPVAFALLAWAEEAVGSEAPEPERELLAVFEAEAPTEREGVEEANKVGVFERLEDGVAAVPLAVGVPVTVPEGVGDAVLLVDAPGLSDAVGLGGTVGLADSVKVPVGVAVLESHAWELGLGVVGGELLPAPDALLAPDAEAFTPPEEVALPEAGGGASIVEDSVGLGLTVELSGVTVRVEPRDAAVEFGEKVEEPPELASEPLPGMDGVGEGLLLGLVVLPEDAVEEAEKEAVVLGVSVGEGVSLSGAPAEAEEEIVEALEGDGEAVPLEVPLGE